VSGPRLSDFVTLTTYAQVPNLKSKATTFLQAQPINCVTADHRNR